MVPVASRGQIGRENERTAGTSRRFDDVEIRVGGSDHADVLRLVTLAARADVELDGLALVEGLVALGLDVGEVHEHVVAIFTGDEAEALLSVEELHSASSQ